ncbi:DUF4998 domain-containing protein [Arcticibacter sp.]|uniref:DUF4998 domain-containing protein n=1 Tax=Arcticibacter sp. TaxID=1872630 RepID=UPI003890118D
MRKFKYLIFNLAALIIIHSCKKSEHDSFRDFFEGKETVYPGTVKDVVAEPGNLRVGLKWKSSSDPSITGYIVYYNNRADSQVVVVNGKEDSVRTIIEGLSEFPYSFTLYSYNRKGNRSIPREINNIKVYGPNYGSKLLNRPYNADNPYEVSSSGHVKLNFANPDTLNIINTGTTIHYTNTAGEAAKVTLPAESSSITITDFKSGTEITYRSSYIPVKGALDTFTVAKTEVFPKVFGNAACDKSLFRLVSLPFDMGALPEAGIQKLWDGSVGPQDYPNIFHSDDATSLPRTLTVDLGKVYNRLTQIEETGRVCCHNPVEFEVWGIADTTNAIPTVPSNSPVWAENARSKGWMLLKEVVRNDDGVSPRKFELESHASPVRYVRIRVKRTANGNTSNVNMSEIALFYDVFN